jgi:hypothetical protein
MNTIGILILVFGFATGVFVLTGEVVGALICVALTALFTAAELLSVLMGVA